MLLKKFGTVPGSSSLWAAGLATAWSNMRHWRCDKSSYRLPHATRMEHWLRRDEFPSLHLQQGRY